MGDGDSGALPTLALQRQRHALALVGTGLEHPELELSNTWLRRKRLTAILL